MNDKKNGFKNRESNNLDHWAIQVNPFKRRFCRYMYKICLVF